MNKAHLSAVISVNKLNLHTDGRPSIVLPCNSSLTVKAPVVDEDDVSSIFEKKKQMMISQGLHRKIVYS